MGVNYIKNSKVSKDLAADSIMSIAVSHVKNVFIPSLTINTVPNSAIFSAIIKFPSLMSHSQFPFY